MFARPKGEKKKKKTGSKKKKKKKNKQKFDRGNFVGQKWQEREASGKHHFLDLGKRNQEEPV